MWHFAESWCIMHNVSKAMRSEETSHRTHYVRRTCVGLRRWENQRRLSSCMMMDCWCYGSVVDVRYPGGDQFWQESGTSSVGGRDNIQVVLHAEVLGLVLWSRLIGGDDSHTGEDTTTWHDVTASDAPCPRSTLHRCLCPRHLRLVPVHFLQLRQRLRPTAEQRSRLRNSPLQHNDHCSAGELHCGLAEPNPVHTATFCRMFATPSADSLSVLNDDFVWR